MSQNESSHIADGISQSERYPLSLRPDFFRIEEREKEDLLKFIIELSRHFNYYNLNNEIDGNWQEFLIADVNIILRVLPKFGINSYIRQYDNLKNRIIHETDENVNIRSLSALLRFIDTFITFQVTLHQKFRTTSKSDPGIFEFRKLVKGYDDFDEESEALKRYYYLASRHFGTGIRVPLLRRFSDEQVAAAEADTELQLDGSHTQALINNLLPYIDKVFYSLRSKYNRLSEAAELYLHKQRSKGDSFEPHIALLITFLDLYEYLKKDINSFTKKHLDFYYNRILQLNYKAAIPDKVNLVFDLNPAGNAFLLPKGELLPVKNPASGTEIFFQTENDLFVTKASIKKLNTVYVSENVKIPARAEEDEDVREMQVFVADNPVYQPDNFLSGRNDTRSWPLIGEDQAQLSAEERSMLPAEIALYMASPLLYARDGKRNFRIRFYISKKSSQQFIAHVNNYANVSGTNQKVLIYEMLSKAFNIDITGDEEWISIEKYTASFDPDMEGDHFIELDFELKHNDAPTAVYSKDIHGFEYDTEWPMIRFVINNDSFHNPYTFLKDIHIERVAIRLSVTESEHLTMRNNVGAVSTASPFQLFGPIASVGSYLDIRNGNIFNCYTRNFTIRINWFDLPRDKGGFEAYYRSYEPKVKNDSFKISISGLNEGRFQPALKDQQSFNLFAINDEPGSKGTVCPVTNIKHIDFSKIHFDNTPSFNNEDEAADGDFREGAVRLEFISPEDGFGQKIYPTLFSEIIMHNAKWYKRKIPLPNTPYAAVVKRITVDYVLEHSEAISGMNKDSEKNQNLCLWHHDSFGYRQIYPAKDAAEMSFVPVVKDQSNLFIGLQDVPENEILTLLFQLEESNFYHSNYEAEPLQWSILLDNKWVQLDKADVLLDETLNFINSGIVRLYIPDLSEKPSTIMDPAYTWIRASCNNRGEVRTKLQALHTQCVSASRILNSEDITAEQLHLPPGSIREFKRKIPQIQQVWQPYPSFGGRPKETEDKYYVRASERLRHKQRPVTTTDIAQLILEAFPDILKVHCYGVGAHNNLVLPGYDIQVVVIPRLMENVSLVMEEPKVALAGLYKIKKLISENISPFIKVDVANPVYERVKVVCSVIFSDNSSKASIGNSLSRLNEDICRFISPWLFSADSDVKMEGRTYLSEILNFIKNCSYVSHVTSFSVLHFYHQYNPQTGRYDARVIDSAVEATDYLKGSIPSAILLSAPEHDITVLQEKVYKKPEGTGIGGLVIAEELLVDEIHHQETDQENNNQEQEELYNFHFNPNA
ncbi:hypothetical protein [Sediminibacterium ginsengisoli]|uniref:Baseplate J-like protein n=1 Tax=Sediminibacterium ginsengisoli TaxID=413434 RepID=A0A1T4PN38_9BACT|nr:hypothetical protein [Sediminibacterium ginsengisoli]SJZ92627.1 hypothetical protein SAMN04488132_10694 [Sediminibacterium ginsengisoli]